MSKITVREPDEGPVPLYLLYQGQHRPQPAFLELDEDGVVSFGVNPEIGNAVPIGVWSGLDIRWDVPGNARRKALCDLLEAARPLLERVHAGRSIGLDARDNPVGHLNPDAAEARDAIDDLIRDDIAAREEAVVSVYPAEEWYSGAHRTFEEAVREAGEITASSTDEDCKAKAEEAVAEALSDNAILEGDLAKSMRRVRDELRDEAEASAAPAI